MGNAVCQSATSDAPLGCCGCFAWCQDMYWFPIPIFLYRLARLIFWIFWRIIALIGTIIGIVFRFLTSLYPTGLYIILFLLLAWLWWYLYPPLAPYISGIVIPVLNLFITLFIVLWNILILLWNVLAEVWNGMVPVIGMLIYIAMEVLVTVMQLIVQILGAIDVQALFKPFMEILKILVQVVLEVLQALLSAALPLLKVLAKIIGALVNVVMKVVEVLLPIVKWLLQILFKVLQPILFIIILIAKLFARIVGGSSRMLLEYNNHMDPRDPPGEAYPSQARKWSIRKQQAFVRSLKQQQEAGQEDDNYESGGVFDDFHYQAYGQAYPSATRHWTRDQFVRAKQQEQDVLNDFIARNPVRSYDYYWSTQRPYLSHVTYEGVYAFTGINENPYGDGPSGAGGRRLLADEGHARGLLSKEEHELLVSPKEDMTNAEYWHHHDTKARNSHEHVEWYQRQFFERHAKRKGIVTRLHRRLLDLNVTLPQHHLDDEEHAATDHRQNQKHWQGETHKKVRCQAGAMCGGQGASLPHPIHPLRDLSYKRQQQSIHTSNWKPKEQSTEQYHKSRFIHLSALIEGLHHGNDRLEWHMQNPVLHKHVREAFNRTTGFETVNDALHHIHQKHGDFYQMIHNTLAPLGDHWVFKAARSLDPEHQTRPYYWDWIKTVKVRERREQHTGRKVLEVQFPGEEEYSSMRRLLEETNAPKEQMEELVRNTQWAQSAYDRVMRERKEYKEHQERTELDPEFEETHNPSRRLLADPALPFAPNPIPNAPELDAEGRRREAVLYGNKPHPDAPVTLFDLLTATDCYTTTPRNPLCLFTFPSSWHINGTFRIQWPDNATGEDFCDYLYRPIPREPSNPAAWISWDWIWNAWISVKVIFSALSSVLTNTLGLLDQKYGQWLGWLIQPLLAFPPGYMPNGIDWVCFAIYTPYAWGLVGALGYLIYILVWPLIQFVMETITAYSVFSGMFIQAEQQRVERMRQTDGMFNRTRRTHELNTPHILRPEVVTEVQAPQVVQIGASIQRSSNPYTDPLPNRYHQSEHENRLLGELECALMEAADEMGMPSRWHMPVLHDRLGPTMGRVSRVVCNALAMASGAHVTEADVHHFEQRYNYLLHSYQMSPYWLYVFSFLFPLTHL
jgi:hypothetical protein